MRFHAGVVQKGISDIGAVTPTGRIMQIECKRPGEKLRPEQKVWLANISRSGGIAMLCTDALQIHALADVARLNGWDRVPSPWDDVPDE